MAVHDIVAPRRHQFAEARQQAEVQRRVAAAPPEHQTADVVGGEPPVAQGLELGADAFVGHPGTSLSPFFYFYFLRHWTRDEALGEIVELSNRRMRAKLHQWAMLSPKPFDAEEHIAETVAAGFGNMQLRVEDTP